MSMNVIETRGLGKRYGGTWALRECTLAVPAGYVAALAGPNGAGKTTLLNLAVGLAEPSAGRVTVLGGRPAGSPVALDGIAFVAQDTPMYKSLLGWLTTAAAAGLDEDGIVALFTSALRDFYKRRSGTGDRRGGVSGETEGVA